MTMEHEGHTIYARMAAAYQIQNSDVPLRIGIFLFANEYFSYNQLRRLQI